MAISWMITETEAPDDQPSAHLWLFWSPMTWLSRSLATLKSWPWQRPLAFCQRLDESITEAEMTFFSLEVSSIKDSPLKGLEKKKRLAPNSDEFSWFSPWFNSSVTCFFSTQMFRTSTFVSAYQIAGSPSRSMYFPYDPTMKFSMKWLGEFLPTRVMRDPWDHWSLDGDEYHYHC